jgi:EAL domain-containing protein (putative c-di-GMP-specific phosphodiesterase class I)
VSHLKTRTNKIPRYQFDTIKLEPVVSILSDENKVRHWEVLCLSIPSNIEGWRSFYKGLIDTCLTFDDTIRFAVNVDSDHVMDDLIWESIVAIAKMPSCIAFEWTETPSLDCNVDEVAKRLMMLKNNYGVELHLDDVGSGEDPMPKATLIHPDVIKIDGPLFHRARSSSSAATIIRSHIECYQAILAESIVEWIESEEDRQLAISLGADFGQGYLYK